MPKKKSKRTRSDKLFVRGPDGSLYILSKSKPPYKLKAAEAKSVTQILSDAQEKVGDRLKLELPGFGSMVNLNVSSFPFIP